MKDKTDLDALRAADPARNVPDTLSPAAQQHLTRLLAGPEPVGEKTRSSRGHVWTSGAGCFLSGWRPVMAAASLAVVGVALTVLPNADSVPLRDQSDSFFARSPALLVSCSQAIVQGTVVSVALVEPNRLNLTMNVDSWVKPSGGPKVTSFDLVDPNSVPGFAGIKPFVRGEQLLLRVPVDPREPATPYYGAELVRAGTALRGALATAPVACPS